MHMVLSMGVLSILRIKFVSTMSLNYYAHDLMVDLRTVMRVWLPLPLFHAAKAIMRRRGYKFFSDQM